MRTKLAMFLVLAGGVAGCASNPPPPPPMAMAPEPAPAPAPAPSPTAMNGTYKGAVEAGADNGPRCRKMTTATATVRGKTFKAGGMTGRVGDDGALSSAGKAGGVTGTLANGTLDMNSTVGKCSYHYTLNHA